MKHLILFSVAALSLTACRNDDDNTSSNNVDVLPVKIESIEDGKSYVYNFKYDNNKIVELIGEENNITFTYAGDLISGFNGKDGKDIENYAFTYNSNGQLTSATYTMTEGDGEYTTVGKKSYTYNADGTVTEKDESTSTRKSDPSYLRSSVTNYTYTLNNGQITKVVEDNPYDISTTNYTYDSKNGIFKNVKGFSNAVLGLFEYFSDFSSITQNNFDKIESTTSSKSGSYNNSSSYKHTYEYNANNYPTKITTEYKYDSTSSSSYTYNITYNK